MLVEEDFEYSDVAINAKIHHEEWRRQYQGRDAKDLNALEQK